MPAESGSGGSAPAGDHEVRRVLARASSPAVTAAYEYWLGKQKSCGRPLPGRQHLDPTEMSAFLANVMLFDIVWNGVHCRFRHRLCGTEFGEIFGCDVTGLFIEQTGSLDAAAKTYRRFVAVAEEKKLAYGVLPSPMRDRGFMFYEHLTLPLASDGKNVDMLFGVRCILRDRSEPIEPLDMTVSLPLGAT